MKNVLTIVRQYAGNKISFHAELNDRTELWSWCLRRNGAMIEAGSTDDLWMEAQSQLAEASMLDIMTPAT